MRPGHTTINGTREIVLRKSGPHSAHCSGATYIYSSSEAYNEEQLLDHQRLGNWLGHFGLTPVGGLPGSESGPFHASGHWQFPSHGERPMGPLNAGGRRGAIHFRARLEAVSGVDTAEEVRLENAGRLSPDAPS